MIVHASDIELADYMANPDFSAHVRTADDFLEELKSVFAGNDGSVHYAEMGWPKARGKLEFRPEEITIWAGSNGSRKSMITGQVMLDFAQQCYKSMTISLEMSAKKTLERMYKQATGKGSLTSADCDHAAAVMRDHIYIFDHVGALHQDRLCAVVRWAKKTLGIEHFLIDSMMKVVNGDDDYNGQKDFINRMCELAKETQVHLHIVAHTRKPPESVERVPSKWDIKGSSSVTDLAHNVITLWRNRMKEEGKGKDNDGPDQILDIQKQRNGEFEGKIGLAFHPGSLQFLESENAYPKPYLVNRNYIASLVA
jgi:twinkle protein